LTDVTRFSQRGRINDSERHAQHTRERLGQKRLAGTGGTNQSDIGFLNFDVGAAARQFYAFVMLIDGDGELLLGFVLADYIFVEEGFDFAWFWQGWARSYRLSLLVVADDLVADVDALIADVDSGRRNEFLHFILRLT